MRHFSEFVVDSGRWGVVSATAAFLAFIVGLWERFRDRPVSGFVFVGLSVPLFWFGAYLAWDKKRKELQDYADTAKAPLIYVDFLRSGIHEIGFRLKVLSHGPIHRVSFCVPSVDGFKVRFDVIPSVIEKYEIFPSSLDFHAAEFKADDGHTLGGHLRCIQSRMRKRGRFSKDTNCQIPLTVSFQDDEMRRYEQQFSIECGPPLSADSKVFKEGRPRKVMWRP
jgi:hypothetical protein